MASLKIISLTMTGTSPLLCHNGQTADPLNYYSKKLKEVSGKRKKTDADHQQMAKIEWFAGLYLSQKRFILPAHVIESCIISGAKKSKMGVQTKMGLFVTSDAVLSFDGMPDGDIEQAVLEQMFDAETFAFTTGVKIGQKKVMRTRPIFRNWSAVLPLQYDPTVLNRDELQGICLDAGALVGVGDWRPKYGRFNATFD